MCLTLINLNTIQLFYNIGRVGLLKWNNDVNTAVLSGYCFESALPYSFSACVTSHVLTLLQSAKWLPITCRIWLSPSIGWWTLRFYENGSVAVIVRQRISDGSTYTGNKRRPPVEESDTNGKSLVILYPWRYEISNSPRIWKANVW